MLHQLVWLATESEVTRRALWSVFTSCLIIPTRAEMDGAFVWLDEIDLPSHQDPQAGNDLFNRFVKHCRETGECIFDGFEVRAL